MKRFVLLSCLGVAVAFGTQAQNIAINSTGAAPNASAMLDVVSTTSGLLIPRMNATQRDAIAAPATGLLIFQTNASSPIPANQFWYYDGSVWRPLFTDRIGWSIHGNTGTNANNNFLGTTDNVAVRIRTNDTQRFEFTTGGELRSFTAGAANAPTYSWTTNAVSGIFQPAANTIGFTTNSNERFRIPNANQVHAMANGTAGVPFYSWSANTNTGMFQQAANVIGFSTSGAERFRIPAANQVHAVPTGTAAAPFYSWSTSTGMGLFRQADNVLGVSTGGVERFRIPNAYQVHAMSNGTAGAPFYSWSTNTNLGIYRATTNVMGFSSSGAERMRIGDYSGSIGIGRTATQGALNVGPIVDIYQPLEVGSDGGQRKQATLGYWVTDDVMVNPEMNLYGYVGVYASPNYNAWWESNVVFPYTISNRATKRNIVQINTDESLETLVMADIERIQPSLYDYEGSYEKPRASNDNRYRPQYTLGVITDESPDYILGQTFDKVNIYSLATLALAGVKHNLKAVKRLEATIQDFGSVSEDQAHVIISYDEEFVQRLNGASPVISITPIGQGQHLFIQEKTATGFVVLNEAGGSASFDWIAIAKVDNAAEDVQAIEERVSPETLERLHLSPEKKQEVMEHFGNIKITKEHQPIGDQE